MYYPKFIPPKDDDVDYNPMIEQVIEEKLEYGYPNDEDMDIHDWDDADDLKLINIG